MLGPPMGQGLQADKRHLRGRIWCIYSTVVKIPVCWPCTLPAKTSGIKPGQFNGAIPTRPQLGVVQHLPGKKNWEANPANLFCSGSRQLRREAAALQRYTGQYTDAAGARQLQQASCALNRILIAENISAGSP